MMDIKRCIKDSFAVIGREGSTADGAGFVKKLWDEANSHFSEVAALAKKDSEGNLVGIWGAMSDLDRNFQPWQDNFSKGLYLAGVEVETEAEPPEGWTKWIIPGYEYCYVLNNSPDTFQKMLDWLADNQLSLAGAVHDFSNPVDGKDYLFFPIHKCNS